MIYSSYLFFSGVIKAMRYFWAPGSITALHIELDGYPSMNILIAGNPKIWLIVDPTDAKKYSELIHRTLKSKNRCEASVVHKPGYFLTPKELEKHGIKYAFIIQEVGDLVFVGGDVPHQVINLGFNLADAKLMLTPNLKLKNRELDCRCREGVGYLPPHQHEISDGAFIGFVKETAANPEPDQSIEVDVDLVSNFPSISREQDNLVCPFPSLYNEIFCKVNLTISFFNF